MTLRIGYNCGYTPIELIHAAGCLPVRMLGTDDPSSFTLAEAYTHHNVCPLVKGVMAQTIDCDDFDAVITAATCDGMRGAADNVEHFELLPVLAAIDVPRHVGRESHLRYLAAQLQGLRRRLGEHTGSEVTDDALRASIALYNRLRAGLRSLRDAMGATAFYTLVHRALTEDPEDVLVEVEAAASSEPRSGQRKVRVALLGSCMMGGDYELLDILDRTGSVVVADLLSGGSQLFERDVPTDTGDTDLVEVLARHYWRGTHRARNYPLSIREDAVRELVATHRPHALIHNTLKFCDSYLYDAVHMKRLADELGLPYLALETECQAADSGQLTTRVECFLEGVSP